MLPELLCPAGERRALEAAIDAGADAIYLGAPGFNARQNAVNFTIQDMRESVALAHAYGVKVYVAQNTLVLDRELSDYVSAAESALAAGADALIVADAGGAAQLRRHFPEAVLHASTQMSGHNAAAAEALSRMGFSRMVCAREMSLADIETFCRTSPLEAEVFVHGALCVCHSGQCLFSSVVGGRSGNRGLCAQPCRLPYGGEGKYPLSLKDLALAPHIPELIRAGVASLKIEGRMKSPEYVWAVTKIYRRLLDERRAATPEELQELSEIFSRGGFTDGYFRSRVGRDMLGIRTERDKESTRTLSPFEGMTRKVPLSMTVNIQKGRPIRLAVTAGARRAEAVGQIPDEARTRPLDREAVAKSLTKLGGTPYEAAKVDIELDQGLILPLSALNALRREAVAGLSQLPSVPRSLSTAPLVPEGKREAIKTARFERPEAIPPEARAFFDIIYLPPERYDGSTAGVVLPPVIFDSQRETVGQLLAEAYQKGARHALVGNLGHLTLARELGFACHGDFRLNVTNNAAMAAMEQAGLEDVILSPELTLPQARDIGGRAQVIAYGRLPLMVLEKCVGRELGSCRDCEAGRLTLRDRRGAEFPVLPAFGHRSVIYNSVVTGLSDMGDTLRRAGLVGLHFVFSTETSEECARVISAYQRGIPLPGPVRRMGRNS